MNNREKYRRAFSKVQVLQPVTLEETEMKQSARKTMALTRPALAASLAAVLLGGSGIAYAADFGGMRTTLHSWLAGREQTMNVEETEGGYRFTDPETGDMLFEGGGVAIEPNGSERKLTAEEVAQESAQGAEITEDGSILLYYNEKSWNLDDLFKNTDTAYVTFNADGTDYYAKVEIGENRESISCSFDLRPSGNKEYTKLD